MAVSRMPESQSQLHYRQDVGESIDIALSTVDTIKVLVCGVDSDGNVCVKFWITPKEYDEKLITQQVGWSG